MTKHLVSLSGGKDSTATLAMALELHGHDNVLGAFADTGNEHEAVYDYVRYLEDAAGVPIKWLRADFSVEWERKRAYVAEKWHLPHKGWPSGVPAHTVERVLKFLERGPTGNPYLDLCIIKGRFPSRRAQFCTQYIKTEPLTEYAMELIEQHGSVWSWQGIRLDESHSRKSRLQGTGACVKAFEVVGGGLFINHPILRWTAADVFEAHRLMGFKPNPLYSQGADRVGCMPCINAGKDEILNISKRFPEHIDRIAEWEELVSVTSKCSNATFFAVPGENETARERGSATTDWIRALEEPSACSSSFGLCEGVAA